MKLRVSNLHKSYGTVPALRPVELDVRDGEFLTLLGPSGSGKSTLLMLLSGLLEADGGTITIGGQDATRSAPHQRDIGFVFQNYALFPHLTVLENIAFPLRMRREPEARVRERSLEILQTIQLPDVAERYPRELSGGQQQRVAFARAAVYRPSIILMDEPLGALDKKLRDQMQIEIKRLHAELGCTIVYVTHDQEEAMSMSDRICLMRDGRIVQTASPHEIYFNPANGFVADFFGWTNFLPVQQTRSAGALVEARLAGGEVAHARGKAGDGARPILSVRPQNVSLAATPAAGQNNIPVTYRGSQMLGVLSRHHCAMRDGTPIVSTGFSQLEDGWAPGTELIACFDPERSLLVSDDR